MQVLDEPWSYKGGAHNRMLQSKVFLQLKSAQKCPKVRFAPNTPNCLPNRCLVFPLCEQGGT